MIKFKNIILNSIGFFIFFITVFITLLVIIESYLTNPGPLKEKTIIVIEKGSSTIDIAKDLVNAKIIKYKYLFWIATRVFRIESNLRAGEYEFNAYISPKEVINIISKGLVLKHKFVVVEGMTNKQIITKINNENNLVGKIDNIYEEGWLLPNTYFFILGDKKQDIIDKMNINMNTHFDKIWNNREQNLSLTKKEVIILASIIEKETSVPEERAHIAGVFLNRLSKNMKLQADPTVIYAVSNGLGLLGRSLTSSDLNIDSPYNTYKNFGLPPGAIANPGIDSIKAVLNPLKTDDLYFVSDGKYRHRFSNNLDNHIFNVMKYKETLHKN